MVSETNKLQRLLKAFFSARNVTVDADGLRMWLDAFSDLTPEAIEIALRRYNRECGDHPTPAAVRRYAGAAALTDEQRAGVAWRSVRSVMLKYGAYYAINFDDPIIHAAIRGIGGWVNLCNTQFDEMPWKEKAFVAAYVAICRCAIGDFRPLNGLIGTTASAIAIETNLLPHCAVKALPSAPVAPSARIAFKDPTR